MTDREALIQRPDCNGQCPPIVPQANCCRNCVKARRRFFMRHRAEPEIAGLWDDKAGFWDREHGCRLPRAVRPTECLQYDCHDYVTIVLCGHLPDGRWVKCVRELPRDELTTERLHERVDSALALYLIVFNQHREKQLNVPERIEKCRNNEPSTCSSD